MPNHTTDIARKLKLSKRTQIVEMMRIYQLRLIIKLLQSEQGDNVL